MWFEIYSVVVGFMIDKSFFFACIIFFVLIPLQFY